jgi:hypothetical protein
VRLRAKPGVERPVPTNGSGGRQTRSEQEANGFRVPLYFGGMGILPMSIPPKAGPNINPAPRSAGDHEKSSG